MSGRSIVVVEDLRVISSVDPKDRFLGGLFTQFDRSEEGRFLGVYLLISTGRTGAAG